MYKLDVDLPRGNNHQLGLKESEGLTVCEDAIEWDYWSCNSIHATAETLLDQGACLFLIMVYFAYQSVKNFE